jgi:hypothetical protein
MGAQKKFSDVLIAHDGEIQKRPPIVVVKREPADWWVLVVIAAFFLGCWIGQLSAFVPLGE